MVSLLLGGILLGGTLHEIHSSFCSVDMEATSSSDKGDDQPAAPQPSEEELDPLRDIEKIASSLMLSFATTHCTIPSYDRLYAKVAKEK
jgi:hypothetical protein